MYPFLQLQVYERPLEGTEKQVPYEPHGFPVHRAEIIADKLHLESELPGILIRVFYQNLNFQNENLVNSADSCKNFKQQDNQEST